MSVLYRSRVGGRQGRGSIPAPGIAVCVGGRRVGGRRVPDQVWLCSTYYVFVCGVCVCLGLVLCAVWCVVA